MIYQQIAVVTIAITLLLIYHIPLPLLLISLAAPLFAINYFFPQLVGPSYSITLLVFSCLFIHQQLFIYNNIYEIWMHGFCMPVRLQIDDHQMRREIFGTLLYYYVDSRIGLSAICRDGNRGYIGIM